MIRFSVVIPTYNRSKLLKGCLKALLSQTFPKDKHEIIIIDAGSTDKTIKLIKSHSLKLKLFIKPHLNRSQARNLAIKKARHSVICVSDAGNTLDPDWLKRITSPFKNKQVDTVAGYYQIKAKTIFQKSVAPFVAIMPDKFNPQTFLPSSRSLAFRRSAWKKVGQYPEELDFCEDLVFAQNLKAKTNLVIKPQALVYWRQAKNLTQFFKQIKNYASGDVQARYKPHLKKIFTTFARYPIFIIFPPIFILYLLWPIFKHYHYINHPFALIYLPLLQVVKDLGIMIGAIKAYVSF